METIKINGRVFLLVTCKYCSDKFSRRKSSKAKNELCRRCVQKASPSDPKKCMDCETIIYNTSVRCKVCSNKSRKVDRKKCLDCGSEISLRAKERCLPCHNKKQDKGLSRSRTKFNASKKWSSTRKACFDRDDYTCQICGVIGGVLNAHHIKQYSTHESLRLVLSNLLTLCVTCHRGIHFGKNK